MTTFFSASKTAIGLSLLLLVAACASGPKKYDIRGEADSVVNRDVSGAPLSVVVRVYQLKSAEEFSKLTFDTLASGRPEAELLGSQLLEKTEVVLVPGNNFASTEKLQEDTKYVGVVGFFRRPDAHYWRYLVDAEKVRSDGLAFRAQDCYLKLLGPKAVPIPGQPQEARPDCSASQTPVLVHSVPVGSQPDARTVETTSQPAQQPTEKKRSRRNGGNAKYAPSVAPAAGNGPVPTPIKMGMPASH